MFWFGLDDLPHRQNEVAVFVGRIFFILVIASLISSCSKNEDFTEFDPCGFEDVGIDEKYILKTRRAKHLHKVYIRKSYVVEIIAIKSKVFQGPVCTIISYGTERRYVIGDIHSVISKLNL